MYNREKLEQFAIKHKVIFEDRGEVGIGRPCVGFIRGDGYVDYNPRAYPDFDLVFPDDAQYDPPLGVADAYHKSECIAVLVHSDDYDEALRQLEIWVDDMERRGAYLVEYQTGATGIQAIFTGVIGYAFRFGS